MKRKGNKYIRCSVIQYSRFMELSLSRGAGNCLGISILMASNSFLPHLADVCRCKHSQYNDAISLYVFTWQTRLIISNGYSKRNTMFVTVCQAFPTGSLTWVF